MDIAGEHRGQILHRGARTNWSLGPDASAGLWRKLYWDARPIEIALPVLVCLAATASVLVHASWAELGWSPLQYVVGGWLALNLGFAVAIGTGCVKRYFHQRGGIYGGDLALMLVDAAAQIALFDLVFIEGPTFGLRFGYTLVLAGWIVAAGLLISHVPLYLRRPISHVMFVGGLGLALQVLPAVPGMVWLPIGLVYKYLVTHLPREEPYRPD